MRSRHSNQPRLSAVNGPVKKRIPGYLSKTAARSAEIVLVSILLPSTNPRTGSGCLIAVKAAAVYPELSHKAMACEIARPDPCKLNTRWKDLAKGT